MSLFVFLANRVFQLPKRIHRQVYTHEPMPCISQGQEEGENPKRPPEEANGFPGEPARGDCRPSPAGEL